MRKTLVIMTLLIATILLYSPVIYASNVGLDGETTDIIKEHATSSQEKNANIINELIEYRGVLEIRSIVSEVFRNMKKTVLTLLYDLTSSVERSFYKTVDYLDIINGSNAFKNLEENIKPVVLALLVLGLSLTMLLLLYGNGRADAEKRNSIKNLFLIILVFVSLPMITNILVETTKTVTTEIPDYFYNKNENISTITESLFTGAFYDVLKARDSGFPIPKDLESLRIEKNAEYITAMDLNEIVELKDANSDVLKHELRGDGVIPFEEAGFLSKQTGLDAFSPAYYRWSINFILPFFSMLILLFVYIFASIRTARVILDLAVNRIFVLISSPFFVGDIGRVKEILKHLLIGYLQIFGVAFSVALFGLFITLVNNSAMNAYLKLIFYLGGGFAAIDGAKFFETVFGTDIGINSQRAVFAAFTNPIRSTKDIATSPVRGYQRLRRASDDKMFRLSQKASRSQQLGTSSKREQQKILRQVAKNPSSKTRETENNSNQNDSQSCKDPISKTSNRSEASVGNIKSNSRLERSFENNRIIGDYLRGSKEASSDPINITSSRESPPIIEDFINQSSKDIRDERPYTKKDPINNKDENKS